MKSLFLAVVCLLGLGLAAASVTCDVGTSGYYVQTSGFDVCISYSVSGVTTKSGVGTGTGADTCATIASTYSGYSGYSCCSTNLCNAATTGISCYVGSAGLYTQTSGFDVCISYSLLGISTKSGVGTGTGASTCSSIASTYSGYSGYSCCSSNLCNGAKINGLGIVMASTAAMIALFRAM